MLLDVYYEFDGEGMDQDLAMLGVVTLLNILQQPCDHGVAKKVFILTFLNENLF